MNAVAAYTVPDMERIARAFVGSKLFGVQNVDQALALCLIAQAEGRHPASAAQDYDIIQGKPAKKAKATLRDFLANGGKVEWHERTDTRADATFSHPAGGTIRVDWDLARAAKAGLSGKDTWKKFPRAMLNARVISEGVGTVYPMATSGMYAPEEVQDFGPEPQGSAPMSTTQLRDVTPREPEPAAVTHSAGRHNANQCKTVTTSRPDTGEIVTKSELAAKLAHEMTDVLEVTELLAWRRTWEPEVATWPLNWEAALWERYDLHMEDLRAIAGGPQNDLDSFRQDGPGDLADGDGEGFPGDRPLRAA